VAGLTSGVRCDVGRTGKWVDLGCGLTRLACTAMSERLGRGWTWGRGLKARHSTCAWPGCDRPIGWTYAHHVELWAEGGQTNLRKMVPLCWHHHRLVHEGGWQVVMAGERLEFIAPERVIGTRRRWGERWAA